MSVSDLHPEGLLDKLGSGELSASEQEHLRLHVRDCAVCRFELEVRADLETEAATLEFGTLSTQNLLGALEVAPRAPLLTPVPAPEAMPRRRLRGRRRWTVAVVAAVLAGASGAAAFVSLGVRLGDAPDAGYAPPTRASAPVVQRRGGVAPADVPKPAASAPESKPPSAEKSAAPKAATPAEAPRGEPEAARQPAPEAQDEPVTSAALFSEANQARRVGDFSRASGLYRTLQRDFPGSQEARLSLVTLGTMQLDSGNPRAALTMFNRYLSSGGGPLEAEALYGRARALSRMGREGEASGAWKDMLARHPDTGYATEARERLRVSSAP